MNPNQLTEMIKDLSEDNMTLTTRSVFFIFYSLNHLKTRVVKWEQTVLVTRWLDCYLCA